MAYKAPKKRIDTTARRSEIMNPHLKEGIKYSGFGNDEDLPWQSRISLVDNDEGHENRNEKGHQIPTVWGIGVLSHQ